MAAIEARNVRVILADTGAEALHAILDRIPAGAEVMNGSSTTRVEIGFDRALDLNTIPDRAGP